MLGRRRRFGEDLMNKRIDQLLILLGIQDSDILPRAALSMYRIGILGRDGDGLYCGPSTIDREK